MGSDCGVSCLKFVKVAGELFQGELNWLTCRAAEPVRFEVEFWIVLVDFLLWQEDLIVLPEVCSAHVVGVSLHSGFNIVGRYPGLEGTIGP